jgi:hypothetical protein
MKYINSKLIINPFNKKMNKIKNNNIKVITIHYNKIIIKIRINVKAIINQLIKFNK